MSNRILGFLLLAGGAIAAVWLFVRRNQSPASGPTATGDFGSLGQIGSNISQDSTPAIVAQAFDFVGAVERARSCWRRETVAGNVGGEVSWVNARGERMQLPWGISPANDCATVD